jgi:hypothetical protein
LCNLSLSSPFNLIEDDRFPMLLLYMDYLSFVKIFKGHYTSPDTIRASGEAPDATKKIHLYAAVCVFFGFLAPYFDLPCFRSATPAVSKVPLIM